MYPRPNPYGFSGIDAVLILIAGLVGITVGAMLLMTGGALAGAVLGIGYLLKRMLFRPQQSVETGTSVLESAAKPQVIEDPESVQSIAADRITNVRIGRQASVHCRFYPESDQVTRIVVFIDRKLITKFGRKLVLTPLRLSEHSQRSVETETEAEVKALIKRDPPDKCRIAKVERQQDPEPSEVTKSVEPPKATAPLPKESAPAAAKGARSRSEMTYRGTLIDCGSKTRNQGQKSYMSYCVLYEDENLGSPQELWGVDLERAIKDACAEPGDRVQIMLNGETPTLVKGKTVNKKIWSIVKI